MTREEAIEKLELMRQKVDEETYRALILAIKALENHDTFMKYAYSQGKQDALSQEPCTDAVSRQAVLDIVCGNYKKDGWGESNFYKAIKQLPSVTHKSGKCYERGIENEWCKRRKCRK